MGAPGPTTTAELAEVLVAFLSSSSTLGRPFTERLYGRLPEVYRTLDAEHGDALLGYIAAIGDLAGVIEYLADGVDYVAPDEGGPAGDTSILVDPVNTPAPAWLAQAVGVNLARAAPGVTAYHADARAAIVDARNGWRAGSAASIEAAARRALTGAATVTVRAGLDVDPFVITISTRASETPDPTLLEQYVEAVRPAGHAYAFDNDVGSWAGIEATAPTWADVDAVANWSALQLL